VAPNARSLSWLSTWPLLRGPFILPTSIVIRDVGDPVADPLLPAAWSLLASHLNRAGFAITACVSTIDLPVLNATLDWLKGVSVLRKTFFKVNTTDWNPLDTYFRDLAHLTRMTSLAFYFKDEHSLFWTVNPGNALARLSPLKGLRELDLGRCALSSAHFASSFAALSSLTALTLPLARWDRSFGPLPPALHSLKLDFKVSTHQLVDLRALTERTATHIVPLSLACPHLASSVRRGGAAASLRRLSIHMDLREARLEETDPEDEEEVQVVNDKETVRDFCIRLTLCPASIPCAFPGLERLHIAVENAYDPEDGVVPQTADISVLLRTAPALKKVRLDGFDSLSFETLTWVLQNRPGYRLSTEPYSTPYYSDLAVVLRLKPE
jgi:hypothetical protein